MFLLYYIQQMLDYLATPLVPIAAVFIIPAAFGVSALAAARIGKEKITLLLGGTIVGLATVTTVIYLLMPLVPLTRPLLAIVLLFFAAAAVLITFKTQAQDHW